MTRGPRRRRDDESAVTTVFFTLLLTTLLIGVAAFAVDVPGWYQRARIEQNFADLACLAGAPELPTSTAATTAAARNISSNLEAYDALDPTLVLPGVDWTSGSWTVRITTPVDGDPNKMTVYVEQETPSTFAKVYGRGTQTTSRLATCEIFSPGGTDLPFGVLPGPFVNGLVKDDDCTDSTGNCQILDVPRATDDNKRLDYNLAEGGQQALAVYGTANRKCTTSTAAVEPEDRLPCDSVDTNTGQNVGTLSKGLVGGTDPVGRLVDPAGFKACNNNCEYINDDDFADVVQTAGTGLVWNGVSFTSVPKATVIESCSHPRLGRVPIVAQMDDTPDWPNGKKEMKILGFYEVFIDDPNEPAPFDFANSGALKKVTAQVFDASDATCVGPNGETVPYSPSSPKLWRLVPNG